MKNVPIEIKKPEENPAAQKSFRRGQLIIAFLSITLLSIIGMAFLFETNPFVKRIPLLKYVLYAVWILAILLIGYRALINSAPDWIPRVWLWGYIFGLGFLLIMGLGDSAFHFPYALKKDANHFRTFFMSPLPFALCWLLIRTET